MECRCWSAARQTSVIDVVKCSMPVFFLHSDRRSTILAHRHGERERRKVCGTRLLKAASICPPRKQGQVLLQASGRGDGRRIVHGELHRSRRMAHGVRGVEGASTRMKLFLFSKDAQNRHFCMNIQVYGVRRVAVSTLE